MELTELLGRPARWASVLRWSALAGLELGVIGPFGSYKANFFSRLAYWTVLFCLGGLVLWPTVLTAIAFGLRRGISAPFSAVAILAVACVPLAILAAAGCYLFWPVHASGIRPLEYYGLTAVVVLPATAGLLWLELAQWRPPSLAGTPTRTGMPLADAADHAGLGALPDHLLEQALCLQMEDHHVRVHTRGRSILHFAAMKQLVDTIDRDRGLLVHRSWWVARDAVRGWCREERSTSLILANGLRVPVARNRVATLRARGWLDDDRQAAPGGERRV